MSNRLVNEWARILTTEGIPLTTEGLVAALGSKSLHVRIGAAIILGRGSEVMAIPHLKPLLKDQPIVRVEAAMSLALLRDKSGIPTLIEALDGDLLTGAPITAAGYLAVLDDPRGYKVVLKALSSNLAGIRLMAVVALKSFLSYHGKEIYGRKVDLFIVLEKALIDPVSLVRREVLYKLARLDDSRSPILLAAISRSDSDERTRLTAGQLLSSISARRDR